MQSQTAVGTLRLRSKEEQEFWDKAFLAALGKTNSCTALARGEADLSIQVRRGREDDICRKIFGLAGQFTCKRIKGHKGRCQDY